MKLFPVIKGARGENIIEEKSVDYYNSIGSSFVVMTVRVAILPLKRS